LKNHKSSYSSILKATSLFGGVQIISIIIKVVKSKFMALFLGAEGIGISGLLTSSLDLVSALTNFGLHISAVKDVSEANASENKSRVAVVITVLKKILWITGILGLIFTIVLSSVLSEIAFGTSEYSLAFVWLSITLLFTQLTSGHLVLLQGLQKLKFLAKANLLGSFIGTLVTIPLYYFFRIDAIVPGIIIFAICNLIFSWYYARQINVVEVKISLAQTFTEGKNMITLGFMISLSVLVSLLMAYVLRIFISNNGGLEQVGFYTAGFIIINTYVGLIFNAMGKDYFPRLSSIAKNNKLCIQVINQQAEIALLIIAPIIIIFLIFIKWIVVILYSSQFIPVIDLVHWAALGMLFKTASWSIAYIFLAKGASKLFFLNELLSSIYVLIFNLIGYYYWGLTGLGVSFLLSYFVYLVQVFLVTKKKYAFNFSAPVKKIFIVQFSLCVFSFVIMKLIDEPYTYPIGLVFLIASSYYSYLEIDKRVGLRVKVIELKNKYFRNL